MTRSFERGQPIPSGDNAFVIHTQNCAGKAPDVTVVGPDGTPIDIELEELDSGTFLARSNTVLEPGTYTVIQTTADGKSETTEVVVEESAPLPMTLGTVSQTKSGCSGMSFDLTLSPEALKYAHLIALSISIDGGEERDWVDYGMLDVTGDRARLFLERCTERCLSRGDHDFRVRTKIAGEVAEPDVVEGEMHVSCTVPDGDEGCSLSSSRPSRLPFALLFLLALIPVRRFARRWSNP